MYSKIHHQHVKVGVSCHYIGSNKGYKRGKIVQKQGVKGENGNQGGRRKETKTGGEIAAKASEKLTLEQP